MLITITVIYVGLGSLHWLLVHYELSHNINRFAPISTGEHY